MWPSPWRAVLDRRDERAAQRLRRQYGQHGWLLSWAPFPNGRWLARLSRPEWPETVERTGGSRIEAIQRADHALHRESDAAMGSPPIDA